MEKIKLTKNELKKQKDALKRYNQYLPTLLLKKQQLQAEIIKIIHSAGQVRAEKTELETKLSAWVDVFSENAGIEELLSVKSVITRTGNIAGIDVPTFAGMEFEVLDYDFYGTPLWVDTGIVVLKQRMVLSVKLEILDKQLALVQDELRITTQRVNLFEKVKIPQTKDHIKKIGIYLGDVQTAAVAKGKIAKSKIQKKSAYPV
ncbi:MAG TPA: V-type ATP synthase subunit D [Candidatus Margulisbacteria bacterium]|nr:MAG: V-type ATP synthase subunit D [Candidatus Margulisbacteria bacterium GWD2_39_127]OGI03843.1 MAG: V-type ATP synthase subunit D [Candidatus Margulisbacteria bacterium GWF2_38_17]OGI06402.1 MAG: V-type ATP synthase subunit D [Candidatus Margulisbacteria bacterium GWE2_39_32]HAR63533.1 V-type ATP synthase subunit D [Candidatus Margulisiibacteriota bacterium]HCT86170.1 V-type ATP synthase subunit D [Candidatus Margulisiibacteriota bacterium]